MSDLEEVIDQLWLHNTFEEDPWTVDRAFAAIRDDGEVAIDGLIWALGHKDLGLKLLALRLLREFGPEAKRALPAVVRCLDDEDRLVRLTAKETVKLVQKLCRCTAQIKTVWRILDDVTAGIWWPGRFGSYNRGRPL